MELREAGVVEEEWRNDRRRLEEQIRMQEEELMESRSNVFIMCIV